jgi:hypothetical protein
MAFPVTFDISYYRGDSYNLLLNPKNTNGEPFDLEEYTGLFTIATRRGDSSAVVAYGDVVLSEEFSTIDCKINPSVGSTLSAGPYVYDIEIYNASASTNYTLLTGSISVTQDVSRTGE